MRLSGVPLTNSAETLIPGDTLLTLEDGRVVRFDSLIDTPDSDRPLRATLPDGTQGSAGNMRSMGPCFLRSDRHVYRMDRLPDQYCVTVLRDLDHPLGKIFHADGSKSAVVTTKRAIARTFRCSTHHALAALIEAVGQDTHAALMLDHFTGVPVGEDFLVLSEDALSRSLGKPKNSPRAEVLGLHEMTYEGKKIKTVARLKENVSPSVWLALDRDVNDQTPAEFVHLSDDEYLTRLAAVLPGIDAVTRVRTMSSSARAIRDGVSIGGRAGHSFVMLKDASDKDRLRSAARWQAIARGFAWQTPRMSRSTPGQVVGQGWTCLVDTSVFTPGRLLFCGSPVSESVNTVISPQKCQVQQGTIEYFDSATVSMPDAELLRQVTQASGSGVELQTRDDGRVVEISRTLTWRTEVETQRHGVVSVRDAVALLQSPVDKIRCQSIDRNSTSFAALLRVDRNGEPFIYDSGSGVTFRLAPGEEFEGLDDDADAPASSLQTVAKEAAAAANDAPTTPQRGRPGYPPLRVLSPAQLRDQPPVAWLIPGVLPQRGLAVLYGPSGVGKSFVVLDMALALARGTEWLQKVASATGVLYVAAEGSSGFAGRLQAYERHHECTLDSVPFGLVPEAIDLLDGADPMRVVEAAQSRPERVGLIVLDTLNRSMRGNENDAADMTGVIQAATQIADATNALVLIVTHTGKDVERGARGHSSLKAAADAELYVHKVGERRFLDVTKMRDGSDTLRIGFSLQPVDLGIDESTGGRIQVPVVALAGPTAPPDTIERFSPLEAVVLRALDRANTASPMVDGAAVPLERVLAQVPDTYLEVKGVAPGARVRDSALRAIGKLVDRGVLTRDGTTIATRSTGFFSDPISTASPTNPTHF